MGALAVDIAATTTTSAYLCIAKFVHFMQSLFKTAFLWVRYLCAVFVCSLLLSERLSARAEKFLTTVCAQRGLDSVERRPCSDSLQAWTA